MILALSLFVANAWDTREEGTEILDAAIGTYFSMLIVGALLTVVMGFVRRDNRNLLAVIVHTLKTLISGFIGYFPPIAAVFVIGWTRNEFITFAPAMFLAGHRAHEPALHRTHER